MKLQRQTLILLLSAILLAGGIYLYERQSPPQSPAQEQNGDLKELFTFKEDQVQEVALVTPKQKLLLKRAQPPSPTVWQLESPKLEPADDAAVAFLLSQLTSGKSDRTLEAPVSQKAEFGLAEPSATVTIKLNNQQTHQLILGKPTYDSSGLYAQVDPPATTEQKLQVLIVPLDLTNAVNRPLPEWQQAKPKSSPKPNSDPNPTPDASSSAAPSPQLLPSPSIQPSPTPQ
jgi:hypothetical protein